jgi:hypothetical protein
VPKLRKSVHGVRGDYLADAGREIRADVPRLRRVHSTDLSVLSILRQTIAVIVMDDKTLLAQLEDLARSLAIEIRYEPFKMDGLFSSGGLCKLKGEYLLIVNSKSSIRDKVEALATAVNRFDLRHVYVRPGLRAFLEKFAKTPQPPMQEPQR